MQDSMKDRLKNCEQFRDDRSNPSVSEKGKTFQIDNRSKGEVACVKIDGCVFKQADGIKCDFIFEIPSKKKLFYIELKGLDVVHAIKQVHATIEQTKAHYKDFSSAARIIISKDNVPAGVKNRREYEALYVLVNKDLLIKEKIHREIL